MSIPKALINSSDKIIYQVGLNMLIYQQIEGVAKKLALFSDYTFSSFSTPKENTSPWFIKPATNTEKMTMGSLAKLLCSEAQNIDIDDKLDIGNNSSYAIFSYKTAKKIRNTQNIETIFEKVVTARNNLTHHFFQFLIPISDNGKSHKNILEQLQCEYKDAEYLLQNLQQELLLTTSSIKKYMDSLEVTNIINLSSIFNNAYQKYKRKNGWAIWSEVLSFANKDLESKAYIALIKKDLKLEDTQDLLKIFFPNWEFEDESTQHGSRILVKVDNTKIVITNRRTVT